MNKNWIEFRGKVQSQLIIDEFTPTVLVFGFTTEIGNVFETINKEIVTKESYKEELIDSLSEMLWTIAALESVFKLPPSLYSNYIDAPITMNSNHGFELLNLQSDLTGYITELSLSVSKQDLDEVQYNINKLLVSLYNVLIYYNINPLTVLNEGVKKVTEDVKAGERDYQKEFEADNIRLSDEFEPIVLDIKVDKRRKNPFKGVYMKAYGDEFKFTDGDIIADFFSATNLLYSKYKGKIHSINYSPKFREYLDNVKPDVESGFIIGKNVLSIRELLKSEPVVDGVMTIDENARPILIQPGLDTLDSLLDYINNVRNKK